MFLARFSKRWVKWDIGFMLRFDKLLAISGKGKRRRGAAPSPGAEISSTASASENSFFLHAHLGAVMQRFLTRDNTIWVTALVVLSFWVAQALGQAGTAKNDKPATPEP